MKLDGGALPGTDRTADLRGAIFALSSSFLAARNSALLFILGVIDGGAPTLLRRRAGVVRFGDMSLAGVSVSSLDRMLLVASEARTLITEDERREAAIEEAGREGVCGPLAAGPRTERHEYPI